MLAAALAGCSSGGKGDDAGVDAAPDTGTPSDGGGDDSSQCGPTVCIHGDQPPQCPSCSPSNGDICSPPAAVTCNYTNGCSGTALVSSQCTCVLPDASAGDGGDGGSSGTAFWSCQ